MVIALTIFSSCRKHTDTNPSTGGSWIIKGTTYYADSCIGSPSGANVLSAQTPINSSTINTYSELFVAFGTVPLVNSTYYFVPDSVYTNNFDSTQTYFYLTIGGNSANESIYQWVGGGLEAVIVSSTGKVSASATNILVQNITPPYDTTRLTFNITQTN